MKAPEIRNTNERKSHSLARDVQNQLLILFVILKKHVWIF